MSEMALVAMARIVKDCFGIFVELDNALDKSVGVMVEGRDTKKKVKRAASTLEKLKWSFKQANMELLRSHMDRLKASLTLILQVLSYARDFAKQ
jgi:hypothetical protein